MFVRLFGSGGPVAGVDVEEDAVATLDLGEAVVLGFGEGADGFEALPDGFDFVELVVVGEEANLRVVAGGSGGDEELPVGGFEEEELAAELFCDSLTQVGVAPVTGGADFAGVELGGVDVGLGPRGLGVHPDVVVAFGSPGTFVHSDESGAGILIEVFGAADELDFGVVVVEDAGDGFEPERAFEPPVSEELGVEGRAEDWRDLVVEARLEGFVDEMDEVRGVGLDPFGCLLRIVGQLVSHIDLGAGDAPVAMTAGPALLVEVQVDTVTGISGLSGPDLDSGAWVARKDCRRVALVVRTVDVVGLIERPMVFVGHALGLLVGRDSAVAEFVGRGDAVTFFDEVSVDEEELDVGLGERLLDADAVEAGRRG